MDDLTDILRERAKKIPKEVQEAIVSVDRRRRLANIAKNYQLHIDQAGVLDNETVLVMLGLESPDDFVGNITRELGISPAQAQLIANEVNQDIFLPIRESLKQMLEKDAEEEEQEQRDNEQLTTEDQELAPQVPAAAVPGTPASFAPLRPAVLPKTPAVTTPPVARTIAATPVPTPAEPAERERDQLLKEIEGMAVPTEPKQVSDNTQQTEHKIAEAPANLPVGNIAETKLAEMFHLPKESLTAPPPPREDKTVAPAAPPTPPAPPQPKKYSSDPYREPVE